MIQVKDFITIIIGSGFGGQCAAINLLKQGITDFIILERRDFVGGTWCQNNYPGAAVDVQSPLYSLSFEPYPWSQMYAKRAELEHYTNLVIDKYKLRERIKTSSNVVSLEWCEKQSVWEIHVEGRGVYRAQFVINASGPLSTPVIPDFKGKASFNGKSFHTNDWDLDYDYSDKKVAIIGSGASAAQVIPEIAPDVEHLYVFQRSPHWVLPRPDRIFTDFQRKLLSVKWMHKLVRTAIYWGLEGRIIGFKYSKLALKFMAGDKARSFIKKQIKDPQLQKKVTPDFTIGCKRVILSSSLYPAYCRKNVSLFTKGQGIKEITGTGLATEDGQTVDVDLIIYATGYDATDGVISYPVVGREGKILGEIWRDYPRAYLGTTIPDFPNLFIVTGPNTGIGHTSAIFVIESQMLYIMKCIKTTLNGGYNSIEVRAEAEENYTRMIHREMQQTVWETGGCNSWYKSRSGKVIAMFPGFSFSFRWLARRFKPGHHTYSRLPSGKK